MNSFERKLVDFIFEEIEYNNNDFCLNDYKHKEAHKLVYGFLKTIVDNAGCNDYIFVYAITKLEEKHGKYMLSYLFEILDNYCNYPDYFEEAVAFAAYYNIGLHYYRYYQIDKLYEFITKCPYLGMFRDKYPLAFDSIGRYCSMNGMFDRMLLFDHAIIRNLQKFKSENKESFNTTKYGYVQTGDNVAVKIGIVTATCSIFEQSFIRGTLDNNIKADDNNHFSIDHVENLSTNKLNDLIELHDSYKSDNSLINNENLDIAMKYVMQAIDYNPTYPKYPFLKAQLLFYKSIFNKELISFNLLSEIKELLSKAKSLENVKANDYTLRVSKYELFLRRVESYMERSYTQNKKDLEYYRIKDEIIHMQSCPPPQKRIKPSVTGSDSYAFISYSTMDFKSVYCDLLGFKNRGISFWYDAEVVPGEQWHKVIEEKIKNASCIICYISPSFLKSQAIYKELSLFKKYDKPIIWVDLTGKKQISKIIVDILRNADADIVNQISSNMLNIITELVDDDVDMISRDLDPQADGHIDRIEKVIKQKFNSIVKTLYSEHLTVKNNKADFIPNEDYVINDTDNGIFIVMDGISRKRDEYKNNKSIAFDISKCFGDKIYTYIKNNISKCKDFNNAKLMLSDAFTKANKSVADMLSKRTKEFEGKEYPGTVGIVAFTLNNILCYGAIGDCMGILIRGNNKIIFSPKQTTFAFDVLNHEKERELLYKEYVNITSSPYGYGVINGNSNAIDYFNISYINLNLGDVVYLVSDGVSDLIEYKKPSDYVNLSLAEIIAQSNIQDELMNKSYFDDKSIIKISIDTGK